jgi:hypothetical protein
MQYGVGYGTSKKQAKSEAARTTLEILIPEMREKIQEDKRVGARGTSKSQDTDLSVSRATHPFQSASIYTVTGTVVFGDVAGGNPGNHGGSCLQDSGMRLPDYLASYQRKP